MYKKFLILIFVIFVFTSCSSKKFFEPQATQGYYQANKQYLPAKISTFSKNFASLENGQFLSKYGLSKIKLPKGYFLLNKQKNTIIAASSKKKVYINIKGKISYLNMDTNVIAATINKNLLALVFSNNSVGLFDLVKKTYIFKDYQKPSLANDTRVVNPKFMSGLTLFPSLDGRILIVDNKKHKITRNILVDLDDSKFNNIIFFKILKDRLIIASDNRLISTGAKFDKTLTYRLRNIILDGGFIYLSTIDGRIIKLDKNLKILSMQKFKYAKFYNLFFNKKSIFALESQGYLIKLTKNLKKYKVYKIDFNKDEKTFFFQKNLANGNIFYNFKGK